MKISAIIAAAGSASRFGSQKLLEDLNGKSVIERTVEAFEKSELITEIIICTSENIFDEINSISKQYNKVKSVILGGKTRQESVLKGLLEATDADFVAIHDGARPLVDLKTIENTIKAAIEHSNAACAVSVKDTIKKIKNNKIVSTPNREELVQIQTPQVFNYKKILEAHQKFKDESFTDDTLLIEKMGGDVFIVKGCYKNLKITTSEDIEIARVLDLSNK